jgi:hypothetical protein
MPPNIRVPPSFRSEIENILSILFVFTRSSKRGVAQEGLQLAALNAIPKTPVAGPTG